MKCEAHKDNAKTGLLQLKYGECKLELNDTYRSIKLRYISVHPNENLLCSMPTAIKCDQVSTDY